MMPANNNHKPEDTKKIDRDKARKLAGELMSAFAWDATKQGNAYWIEVYINLLKIALIDGEYNE